MGLFRKTLRDAKAFAERGKWNEVIKIIEKHRNDELIIHKDLRSLAGSIDGYIMAIRNLETLLRQKPTDGRQIVAGIEELESDLAVIEEYMKKLLKDKKIVLE